jgi:hypothetical protein
MPPQQKRNNAKPENVEKKPASTGSARKTNNQPKAKTRSRVPRREWDNSYFPGMQGSLTSQIADEPDGTPDKAINQLHKSLIHRFDMDDIVGGLMVDLLIADFWRLREAIILENQLKKEQRWWLYRQSGSLAPVMRYVSLSRRNLDQSLKMLGELEKEAAEAEAFEVEEGGIEMADSPSSQASAAPAKSDEPAPQAEPETSSSEVSGSEQPAPATAEPRGEGEPNTNNNAAVEPVFVPSAPLSPIENDGAHSVTAAATPAEDTAENLGGAPDADVPKAA